MTSVERITAEEFADQKSEFPEGGRWHELHEGRPVLLEAPDDRHGNVVMNLSRQLAIWFRDRGRGRSGYAVHDLGILVRRNPDTVYVPAMSYFDSGPMFSQTDLPLATQIPRMVIDVASSNDRRREMQSRTNAFMNTGIEMIWIVDPFKKEIQVLRRSMHTLVLGTRQTLEGGQLLPEFTIPVIDIFAEPAWWKKPAEQDQESARSE
jgi:Uma2 family endonuclease